MSKWYVMNPDGSVHPTPRPHMQSIEARLVGTTEVGDSRVSTVFLGLDHSYGEGDPVLFETLVFDGALDGEMERYHTFEEAKAGHLAMVKRVQESQS